MCWNRRDVIQFSTVRKIRANRENRRAMPGNEVKKKTHRCPHISQLYSSYDFHRIWTASSGQEMGLCFIPGHFKATWLISVRINNQPIFCGSVQQSVKYEDSRHFVSRRLWTVGTAFHQITTGSYSINVYVTFYAIPRALSWTEETIAT